MMNITATEFKQRLGQYMDCAERHPVFVEKSGRPKSVLLSHTQYQQLIEVEDQYWANQAQQAEAEGYLSEEETQQLLFKTH